MLEALVRINSVLANCISWVLFQLRLGSTVYNTYVFYSIKMQGPLFEVLRCWVQPAA